MCVWKMLIKFELVLISISEVEFYNSSINQILNRTNIKKNDKNRHSILKPSKSKKKIRNVRLKLLSIFVIRLSLWCSK